MTTELREALVKTFSFANQLDRVVFKCKQMMNTFGMPEYSAALDNVIPAIAAKDRFNALLIDEIERLQLEVKKQGSEIEKLKGG